MVTPFVFRSFREQVARPSFFLSSAATLATRGRGGIPDYLIRTFGVAAGPVDPNDWIRSGFCIIIDEFSKLLQGALAGMATATIGRGLSVRSAHNQLTVDGRVLSGESRRWRGSWN